MQWPACGSQASPKWQRQSLRARQARGRTGLEQRAYPQAERLRNALAAARATDVAALTQRFQKEQLGQAIRAMRIDAIGKMLELSQ